MLTLLATLMLPAALGAQATRASCPDSVTYFEYQVTKPARWIADSSLTVHPTAPVRNPANLVQFVVDTSGAPIAQTFRALKVTDADVASQARASVATWRFVPATLGDCSVRQLVQTPIGR